MRLCRAGRLTEADFAYRHVLELDPQNAEALDALGMVCCLTGQPVIGSKYLRKAVALVPDEPRYHNNLGLALKSLGKLAEAEACYSEALRLRSNFTEAHNNLGVVYKAHGKLEKAEASFREALRLQPKFVDAHYNLGNTLRDRGKLDDALACFKTAARHNPNDPAVYNNMGNVLKDQGKLDEALKCFRTVLRLDPGHAKAHAALLHCQRVETIDDRVTGLEAIMERPEVKASDRIMFGFALGKAYDDVGNYDAAFARYAAANRLLLDEFAAQGARFRPRVFTEQIDAHIRAHPPEMADSALSSHCDSVLPVFVVGMPRSGTTLVEQIIASHSRAFGAGELPDIENIARSLPGYCGGEPYPQCVVRLENRTLSELADVHLRRLKTLGGTAERVVDKMPDNVLHLGMIALLFPRAKIIFCRRDPRDTCLSCYFQRFTHAVSYSADLSDCGHRYVQLERLIKHWKAALPLPMLDVEYEQLVANQEAESRRIIEFLGLEWEPDCLEFHRTERAVRTASVWQVRQPLYDRSVGRWRNYEKHLGPLLEIIEGAPS
ncbi:MAG: tetratricopeptide repeat-containing sulfotransferase family protein [Burkholderiales bacterium]